MMGETTPGVWTPLAHRLFALILATNLFATLAVFMNGLAASWAMTAITDSAFLIAGLQTAAALPAFVLALVVGALSDIVRRKTLILVGLGGSAATAAVFAFLSATDRETTGSLLALTMVLGVFTALSAPAWIAVIPRLVPAAELGSAMSLSAAAVNVAMAVGPALAGFIIAAWSPTAVFALNVIVFGGGIVALRWWSPESRNRLPAEHVGAAIRTGLRYVRFDRPLKVTIAKIFPLALAGTVIPALLPVIARFELDAGPSGFGILAAAGGLGAILAVLILPPIRRRVGPDSVMVGAALVQAAAIASLSASGAIGVAFALLTIVGMASLAIVSTAMTALQVVLPSWVRGRGVAMYLFALQAAFGVGSIVWGVLAETVGVDATLHIAAVALGISAFATLPLRLGAYEAHDASPATMMELVAPVTSVHDSDGPILVTATWHIPPEKRAAFLETMADVRSALRRQGAMDFHLVEDVTNPGMIMESFSLATWSEYLRLPSRSVASDQPIHDALVEIAGAELPSLRVHRELDM